MLALAPWFIFVDKMDEFPLFCWNTGRRVKQEAYAIAGFVEEKCVCRCFYQLIKLK